MPVSILPAPDTAWTFRVEGDTGILTLPTFAFWRSDFKPQSFLQQPFDALRGVPFLIIDPRDNEGGDDAIGRALLSHLLRARAATGCCPTSQARDIQRSGVATLLGEPTGGNLRGLNGGELCGITLPASGVGVDTGMQAARRLIASWR